MSSSKISAIKHRFFDNSSSIRSDYNLSFKDHDFDIKQFQDEFNSIYQLFISNNKLWVNNKEIVSYLYYLCTLMTLYYQYDYVNEDLKTLNTKRNEIENYIQEYFSKQDQAWIHQFSDQFKSNIAESFPSRISLSKIRKNVSIINAGRSYWGYSRSLANHAIIYFQKLCETHFDKGNNEFWEDTYVSEEIIDLLNKIREPLVILGITLYTLRFLINLTLLIKHLIQATKNDKLSLKNVLIHELEKRGFGMLSDLVWAIINLITNYHIFFCIAEVSVSPIIVGFLIFDSLLFITQWVNDTHKYNQRLQELLSQEKNSGLLEQIIIKRQIDQLNDQWEVQNACYLINILGANLIAIGFGISLLCTTPLALAGLAFLSSIGNALYNTVEKFKVYQQSKIALRREFSNGEICADEHHYQQFVKLSEECVKAHYDFCFSLALTTGGTAFIITAAVISWPIALSLTLSYVSYKLVNAFQNEHDITANKNEVPADIYRLFRPKQLEQGLAMVVFEDVEKDHSEAACI